MGNHNQYLSFEIACGNKSWVCSVVYTNPIPSVRRQLWHYLKNHRSMVNKSWLILGDLNEVLLPSESRGRVFIHSRATEFAEVVDKCQLMDLVLMAGNIHGIEPAKGLLK